MARKTCNEYKREKRNDSKHQYYKFASLFLLLDMGAVDGFGFYFILSSEEVEKWIRNLKLVMVSSRVRVYHMLFLLTKIVHVYKVNNSSSDEKSLNLISKEGLDVMHGKEHLV